MEDNLLVTDCPQQCPTLLCFLPPLNIPLLFPSCFLIPFLLLGPLYLCIVLANISQFYIFV